MPVSVSLERLVSVRGTESLWPEKFAGLIAKMADDLDEMTPWELLADWLQEHDEPGLEAACRYVAKRQDVSVVAEKISYCYTRFSFVGLPPSVSAVQVDGIDDSTLAGLITDLAARLRKHREEGQ